ncbi:MAG TPA: LytTR family DNA-binding domain-containing protein [Burkholderiaceae bacterium]|nr:LytTR family DNA-binding domain-containing protein [Burkholderiaceae bacterium]
MNPTALIAEDEPLLAAGLKADLQEAWPELQVLNLVADGKQAVQQALDLRPDICFLDIRMPGMSGLEAAQALAEDWPEGAGNPQFPLLVFVTAYDQYAVEAFDRQAVDYLLKPLDLARLDRCIQRLKRKLEDRSPARQPAGQDLQVAVEQLRSLLGAQALPTAAAPARLEVIQAGIGNTVQLVPVDEVIYFEAADKYVRVVTQDREHLIRLSLRELIPQLDPQRFWQVHRGTVVQVRCICSARREDSGKVILTLRERPEKLVASRLYAHLFKSM